MTDGERMSAWQFLRWFAANHTRGQLVTVAGTETIGTVAWAVMPVRAWGLSGWAAAGAGAAAVVLYQALGWYLLGIPRVQKWIKAG